MDSEREVHVFARRWMPVVFVVALACGTSGAGETAEEVLENIREKYETIDDAAVRFSQHVRFAMANIEQQITGVLYVKKGDRYRVELDDQTIVTDGTTVWSFSRLNNQVLIDDFAMDERAFSPENILVKAPSKFAPTLLGPERIQDVETLVIKLVPRDPETFVQSMKVWVNPDTWLMVKVELVDANGKETTYVVNEVQINPGLDDGRFVFQIPDGVDVVDLR
ncbi:MAG: outer membrane lipoprotein carrier protein LolA [Bacteroidetes bacterium]|nr:outer membrane lipoprotein carrier protein LolA [Bacteroidota bacterium]